MWQPANPANAEFVFFSAWTGPSYGVYFVKYPKLIYLRTNFKHTNLSFSNLKLSVSSTAAKVPPISDWVLLNSRALHFSDLALPLLTLQTTFWSLNISPLMASGTPLCPASKRSFSVHCVIFTSFLWCFWPILTFWNIPSPLPLHAKSYPFYDIPLSLLLLALWNWSFLSALWSALHNSPTAFIFYCSLLCMYLLYPLESKLLKNKSIVLLIFMFRTPSAIFGT